MPRPVENSNLTTNNVMPLVEERGRRKEKRRMKGIEDREGRERNEAERKKLQVWRPKLVLRGDLKTKILPL